MKTKVEEDWDGGGGSEPSDLGTKMRKKKKKKKGKNERERATLPRSDHLWSQSLSPRGEGRPCSPKRC